MNTMNNIDTEAANDYWEKIFSSRNWGCYPPEELIRFVARNFYAVEDRKKIRILEIGCGPGPNIWYLVREGFSVAGIDGSASAIQQAKSRLLAEGLVSNPPLVELTVGNFISLPWQNNTFDAVIDIEALYANKKTDIEKSIDEVKRVLKPGGAFFSKMFADQTTGSDTGKVIEPNTISRPDSGPCAGNAIAHFFTFDEINLLLSDFKKVVINRLHRTEQNSDMQIYEWIVSASI